MKQERQLPSQVIKTFLDFVDSAKTDFEYNLEAMKNEDKITQDYLHKLELEGLNCRERSKIATQLVSNRKARRCYKDTVEELEPIVEFFDDPKNQSFMNHLSQLLGQVRKIEGYHKNRIYMPKVVPGEMIKNDSVSELKREGA